MNNQPFDPFDYHHWNDRIIEHFFDLKTKFGTDVKLNLDEDTLKTDLRGNKDDLVLATLAEAENQNCATIQALGCQLHDQWHRALVKTTTPNDQRSPPPFVAVLALYVLAVDHGKESFATHNFYDRLHHLLGEPEHRIKILEPSFKQWRSLQDWLKNDNGHYRGTFRIDFVGHHRHIGIPRRQCLIVPRDRRAFEARFHAKKLIPGSDLTDQQLWQATRSTPDLLARTRKILKEPPGSNEWNDLVNEIRIVFDNWNAETFIQDSPTKAFDYLPVSLDLVANGQKIDQAYFTTPLVDGLTDQEECPLTMTLPSELFPVAEFSLSTQERDFNDPILVDARHGSAWAERVSWFDAMSFEMNPSGQKITLTRPANKLLVFRKDALHTRVYHEILKEEHIEPGNPYLLVSATGTLNSCPFGEFRINTSWKHIEGFDAYWRPFQSRADDRKTPPQADFQFMGGIPSGPGKTAYLPFGLPRITVNTPKGSESIVPTAVGYEQDGTRETLQLIRLPRAPHSDEDLVDTSTSMITVEYSLKPEKAVIQIQVSLKIPGSTAKEKQFYVDDAQHSDAIPLPVDRTGFGFVTTSDLDRAVRGLVVLRQDDAQPHKNFSTANRLLEKECDEIMPPGDLTVRLMQFMRTRGTLSWTDAKKFLPLCLRGVRPNQFGWKFRHEIERFHALGLLELEEKLSGGFDRLVALNRRLVLLPRLANGGKQKEGHWFPYQALLVGCWLPEELEEIEQAAKKTLCFFKCIRPSQKEPEYFTRSLFASNPGNPAKALQTLHDVADAVQVPFDTNPFACQLRQVLTPLDHLIDSQNWQQGTPSFLYKPFRFFDPVGLCLADEPPSSDQDQYVLWESRDRTTTLWKYFLVDTHGNRYLELKNRQLGRWFVRRQACPNTPIPESQGDIMVPFELRLPLFLERFLTLASGCAPELTSYSHGESPFRYSGERQTFRIPQPPTRWRDWEEQSGEHLGKFIIYPGVYKIDNVWPSDTPMPMIGVRTKTLRLPSNVSSSRAESYRERAKQDQGHPRLRDQRIEVPPLSELLEHDRIIRELKFQWRKSHYRDGWQILGNGPISLTGKEGPDEGLTTLVQVETTTSINHSKTADWLRWGRKRGKFALYVPQDSAERTLQLCKLKKVRVDEIWSYHTVGETISFTLSYDRMKKVF